mgnify:CR=1 FL=1
MIVKLEGNLEKVSEKLKEVNKLNKYENNHITLRKKEEKVIVKLIETGEEILEIVEEKLDNIKLLPNNDIISNLVYNTNGNSVDTTIVNGNVLMENRKILTLDAQNIINKFKNTNKAR